ncbi:MAG: hypothetical protein IKH75_03350 [Ruminococcus sp.]|nr:hypothetical protein [Ruminococcus sp.]
MEINIKMSQEDKEKLLRIISAYGWTIDEITNAFLKWIVDYPDEAVMCIKKWKEFQS